MKRIPLEEAIIDWIYQKASDEIMEERQRTLRGKCN